MQSKILNDGHCVGGGVGAYCASAAAARHLPDCGFDLATPGHDVAVLRDGGVTRVTTVRGNDVSVPAPSGY